MPKAKRITADAALFGAIIHRLRMERGWTLVKFAQRTAMNATYLGVLEKAATAPASSPSSSSPTSSMWKPPRS